MRLSLKNMLLRGLRWRNDMNDYLERISSASTDHAPEERAIIYALFAIAGLLFFAALALAAYIAISG